MKYKLKEYLIFALIFIAPVSIVLLTLWLFNGEPRHEPALYIPSTGCFFRIESNDTPEFFTEVFVYNKLKVIIDDEVYWLHLTKGVYP